MVKCYKTKNLDSYYLEMVKDKKEKKTELEWLTKRQQKRVEETLEILQKYRPNLKIKKVENWFIHLDNWDEDKEVLQKTE